MKRAVITGPTGVVGSALVRALSRTGTELLLLVREGSPNNARIRAISEELMKEGAPPIIMRECSLHHMRDMENDTGVTYDVFYHLSWGGTKGKDRFDPYIHNKNVEYALDAAALAKRLGCSCFVGAGSQAEYGRSDARLSPDTPTHPENAYGIAKLCAGQMTREYAHMLGMRHVWTRILSVYGPNDGEKTLITYLVNSLLHGERPAMTAGGQIWDYVYSEDAAEALAAVGERGKDGETYLIASGQERTLKEYVLELREVLAPDAEIGFGEIPYGERQVMNLTADISKTTEDTGWVPRISFAEGIKRMAGRKVM